MSCFILFILMALIPAFGDEGIKQEKKRENKLVAIPTLSADKSKGAGVGILSMYFFKVAEGEETPLSRLGLAANTTTVGNYTVVLFQQIFTKNDEWRITAAEILANSNFQTYVSSSTADSSLVIPYNNYFEMLFLNISKRLPWKNFYLGPQVTLGSADTTFELENSEDVFTRENLNSWGLTLTHDTRKNKFNADQGDHIQLRWNDFPDWMSNISDFSFLNLEANFYEKLNAEQVMAYRLTGYYAYGDVPFVGEKFVGNNDIRGYTTGEFRGDEVYTGQAELRWNFKSRWGGVGFGGLAFAKSKSEWSDPLPSIGTGLRYLMIKDEGINAGIDVAFGKADFGVYFRITEAF